MRKQGVVVNQFCLIYLRGGVLPPGFAFAKTNLIDRLCENGFTFDVIDSDDVKIPESKKIL